jgi:hypothetical protein
MTRLLGAEAVKLRTTRTFRLLALSALGVGVGTVVHNQVGAIIAGLGLLYVADPLLGFFPGIGPAVQKFGLGGYALAILLAGALLLTRRDITT